MTLEETLQAYVGREARRGVGQELHHRHQQVLQGQIEVEIVFICSLDDLKSSFYLCALEFLNILNVAEDLLAVALVSLLLIHRLVNRRLLLLLLSLLDRSSLGLSRSCLCCGFFGSSFLLSRICFEHLSS